MIINLHWLEEYIDNHYKPEDLIHILTAIGFEVEHVTNLDKELEHIKIGLIKEKKVHPKANDMYVCQVEVEDNDVRQIVCASEHPIEEGWKVPVALSGTKLPTGIQIKKGKFRGEMSDGMICLDREMGIIPRGSGLQTFSEETKIGNRLIDIAPIDDVLAEVSVLPNRPDCLGLIGIARELVAALGGQVRLPKINLKEDKGKTENSIKVTIESPEACPRYSCRVIRNVKIGKSPMWLSSKLVASGHRSINNVVDITNLVLLEWGHPLHAFDLDKITSHHIIVRNAMVDERTTLLDGKEITLNPDHLVIADAKRPIALAGVMGGANSEVSTETNDIVLECAYFDPVRIRNTSKKFGVQTDSSYRFERGMDPNEILDSALERATSLICEVAGGVAESGIVDTYPHRIEPRRFHLPISKVNKLLGVKLDQQQVNGYLEKLGMKLKPNDIVEVPTKRVDIDDPVVLIEDIARLYGYNQIPMAPSATSVTLGSQSKFDQFRIEVATRLINQGFFEARTFPLDSIDRFGDYKVNGNNSFIHLKNPLTTDMNMLRNSFLPRHLDVLLHNIHRNVHNLRFFELDRYFNRTNSNHTEKWVVAGLATGQVLDCERTPNPLFIDFFRLKGEIENILECLNIRTVSVKNAEVSFLHPRQSVELLSGEKKLGLIGQLSPYLTQKLEIGQDVFFFELYLKPLFEASNLYPRYRQIPRVPGIERDMAITIDKDVKYVELEKTIRSVSGNLLKNINCFDIYEGNEIPDGRHSIGLRLFFQDLERTLSSEEVSDVHEKIVHVLKERYDAVLRGQT